MAGQLAVVLAGYALCMVKIRGLRIRAPRLLRLAPLTAVALLYLGVHQVLSLWMWVATNDRK